jgi:hypothetical protein
MAGKPFKEKGFPTKITLALAVVQKGLRERPGLVAFNASEVFMLLHASPTSCFTASDYI